MLNRTIKQIKNFTNDENGAVAIEYALIIALIGTAIIGGLKEVGASITLTFEAVNAGFSHIG